MTQLPRNQRMTKSDKELKIERQRNRRKIQPAITQSLRQILGDEEYLPLYNQMLKDQGGKCAICKKEWEGPIRFHMDHCHETLEIRGLLCYSCNSKLGFVEKYLEEIGEYLGW